MFACAVGGEKRTQNNIYTLIFQEVKHINLCLPLEVHKGSGGSHSEPCLGTHRQGVVELKPGRTGAQSGYVSRENSGTPHVTTANSTASTPITLTPSPAFTCSDDQTQLTWLNVRYAEFCFIIFSSLVCIQHIFMRE